MDFEISGAFAWKPGSPSAIGRDRNPRTVETSNLHAHTLFNIAYDGEDLNLRLVPTYILDWYCPFWRYNKKRNNGGAGSGEGAGAGAGASAMATEESRVDE